VHLRKSWQPVSIASAESIRERCEQLHSVIGQLAGGEGTDENERAESVTLLTEYLKRHTAITVDLRKSELKGLERRLTPKEDLALWANAHMTGSQRRFMVSELNKLGINPFAPTHAFDAKIRRAQLDTELEFSRLTLTEGSDRPCVKVSSIRDALIQKVRELKMADSLLETPNFGGKLWVAIGGDKGGTTTKLVVSIVNAKMSSSVKNLVLIGMYEGTDNAENMRTAFADFGTELATIQTLPVPETGEHGAVREVPVEQFLVGDTMFISHVLGHMGVAAVFPCPFCLLPKAALKTAGQWDYRQTFDERTIEAYRIAAQSGATGNARTQSEQTTSVTRLPLFAIPVANISPPQLHIALGIGTALYNSLEQCCWANDKAAVGLAPVPNAKKNAKKDLAQIQKQLNGSEIRISDLEERAVQSHTLLSAFITAQSTPPKPKQRCEGIICLSEASRSITERSNVCVSCADCQRWLHFACEGIATLHEIEKSSDGRYQCVQCTGANSISDLVDFCRVRASLTDLKLSQLKTVQKDLKAKSLALEDIVIKNTGPCAKRLAQALKKLGVDVQAYHSCTFVGNHIHKMVTKDGPALLASALGDSAQTASDREKYETLLTGLGRIQSHFAAEFLSETQQSELEMSCREFAADFKRFLPNESVTPKLHFLTAHLHNFAKKNGTLGLLSEQSLESLHARINGIERQFAGIRDVERRMKLAMQHFYVTSSVTSSK